MSVTGTLIWLGGAHPSAVGEAHERSGYALTGAAVTVSALAAGGVAAAASAPMWPVTVVVAVATGAAAVAGVIARALVTSPGTAPRRLWFLGRVLLALVLGSFLGEAATMSADQAAVDRILDEKSRAAAESAPGVVDGRAAVDRALADRAALERTITEAAAEADRALVTARCEFNPTEQCPPTRITGIPGDGPEHRTARAMLDDARARLDEARDRVPGLDQRVTDAEQSLTAAYSAAGQAGDRGPGARWAAMHEHTTASAETLLPRLAALLAGLSIALLPLLTRRWLGVTSLDRRAAARAVLDEAERDAETTIAVRRARLRAAAEELRAEQELDTVRRTTSVRAAPRLAELDGPRRMLAPAVDRTAATANETAPAPEAVGPAPTGASRSLGAASAALGTPAIAVGTGSAPVGRKDAPAEESGSTAGEKVVAFRGPGSSVESSRVIDGSDGRRRTRVIAAIGGLEVGITEFARPVGGGPEIRSGLGSHGDDHLRGTGPQSADGVGLANTAPVPGSSPTDGAAPLPAGLSSAQRVAELPLIGSLPFSGWIGPLVPSFVLDAIDTATRPLRTARQAIEDIEELTFTLHQGRTITVAVREPIATGAEAGSGRTVTPTVVDVDPVGSPQAGGTPVDGEAVDVHPRTHSRRTRFH